MLFFAMTPTSPQGEHREIYFNFHTVSLFPSTSHLPLAEISSYSLRFRRCHTQQHGQSDLMFPIEHSDFIWFPHIWFKQQFRFAVQRESVSETSVTGNCDGK